MDYSDETTGKLIESDPKLQELVQFWQDHASCRRGIDKAAGETAVARIYMRVGVPFPQVRWWFSPIAMILAHQTLVHGLRWVERQHGKIVMQASPEYLHWLKSDDQEPSPGKPLGERTCVCDYYGDRLPMLDCLQHKFLCKSKLSYSQRDAIDTASTFSGCEGTGEQVIGALLSALYGEMEPNAAVFDIWNAESDSLAGLSENCIFWAQDRCANFLRTDLYEHFAGGPKRESCVHAYRELAQHCHVALMREGLCWLCVDPEFMRFDDQGHLHHDHDAALGYRDGTRLYCFQGTVLPEGAFLRPHSLGIAYIDGPDSLWTRREAMVSRYGVKRYLEEQNAELIDARDNEKLWRVTLSNGHTVVFRERSHPHPSRPAAMLFGYEEWMDNTETLADMRDRYDDSCDALSLQVRNQTR